ncbi:hypothetical protein Pfo_031442 [Paulownia fortunei]|nr:hypothetical protein Pfo_031442 [Paulownia fortunei]
MTIGDLVAYLAYVAMLQDPIRSFSMLMNVFQTAQVSYDRIKNILSYEPKILEPTTPQPFPNPLQQHIQLSNVTFDYEMGSDHALNDVSMTIPAGKTTALVGRSGSGKSTIIKLLTRFYDRSKGDILFDNIDIRAFQISDLRQHISVVSQDVTIVDAQSLTILCMAVVKNNVYQFARALLKDAPIVILDEATAALDNESEKTIQHALDNLMVAKTAIVIAHRLSTVHKADQIIVMNDGQVAETGTHDSLLQKQGIYKRLYDAQFE